MATVSETLLQRLQRQYILSVTPTLHEVEERWKMVLIELDTASNARQHIKRLYFSTIGLQQAIADRLRSSESGLADHIIVDSRDDCSPDCLYQPTIRVQW